MPNMDGTGPQGIGAMTGRRLGLCAGSVRRGCVRGFGRGHRFRTRNIQPAILSNEEEKKILEEELNDIEIEKEAIQRRLKEMR